MKTTTVYHQQEKNKLYQANTRPSLVWLLIGLHIFLALGAFLGGGAFILAPDGHLINMPFSHLKNSPFSNFFIPGLLLFTFLGIYPLLVAYALWRQPEWNWPDFFNPFKHMHWSWTGSLATGMITIIWISMQVVWVPFGLVHVFYLAYGLILIGIARLPQIRKYYQHGSVE